MTESPNALAGQPLEIVERDGVRYTILGTAHVSKISADAVLNLIQTGDFDSVAIELDATRHAALVNPDSWAKMDLFKVIRQGKAGMVAANLALGAFQQRIAEQFGVEPGAEMRAAIKATAEAKLPLLLIDRDIGITLKRVYRNIPWWQRTTLFAGLIASVFSNEKITEEDIEKLKSGDMLEATFSEFAESSSRLYEPLISERDRYMAAKLREQSVLRQVSNVLVVIGAGHLKGLVAQLSYDPTPPSEVRGLLEVIPPASGWPKLIPWLIVAFILSGFVIGFSQSAELGRDLLSFWFIVNGGLSALGALIALAHPLTIAGSFIAAPFTSLNPFIGVGFVAAATELWLRKPNVGDFHTLRKDVAQVRGWWRNGVARIFLIFFLTTIGSVVGTWIGGARVVGPIVQFFRNLF
jgi:pheromone shutdown-related protein TraB